MKRFIMILFLWRFLSVCVELGGMFLGMMFFMNVFFDVNKCLLKFFVDVLLFFFFGMKLDLFFIIFDELVMGNVMDLVSLNFKFDFYLLCDWFVNE